jgi:glutamine amidotransferase
VTVTADLSQARAADGLVVPGVGAFAACMAGITAIGGDDLVRSLLEQGRPVLGICVGMQILFESGVEHGVQTDGIGVVPGAVTRLQADVVPHMGWNTITPAPGSALFEGLADERFYFVHSYAAHSAEGASVTSATHGEAFVAALERGSLSATQFHPEKSGDAGAQLLRNWLAQI